MTMCIYVLHFPQQIVEEDSFEDYIPEDIAIEELLPNTAEKETNTECNFCPEGARQLHRRWEIDVVLSV